MGDGMCRVLYVDDQVILNVHEALTRSGCRVNIAPSAEQVLKSFKNNDYDVLLIDYTLPGMNGLELAGEIRNIDESVGIVLMADENKEQVDKESEGLLIWNVLQKPVSVETLVKNVENACELSHIPEEKVKEFAQLASKGTERMRRLHKDLLDETGIHGVAK